MITHIVLYKLINDDLFNIEKTKYVLLSMEGKIPQLKAIEVGVDIVHSDRSYDLALVTKFDSLEDLEAYKIHPLHIEVAKHMSLVRQSSVSVDYEC